MTSDQWKKGFFELFECEIVIPAQFQKPGFGLELLIVGVSLTLPSSRGRGF